MWLGLATGQVTDCYKLRRVCALPVRRSGHGRIDAHLQRYPDSVVVLDVMGTADPTQLRAQVKAVEPEAEEVFFFTASVGALFGVRRRDGSRVAVKFHKLLQDGAYLDELQRVQAGLADAGYPAPRPLGRVENATLEEWLDAGSFRDAHEPEVRTAMARELVRFHDSRRRWACDLVDRSSRSVRCSLAGAAQRALRLRRHERGAEWIDEIARAAKPLRDACEAPEVVGHADWSAKHLRFDEFLRATAVYDWDSVDTQPEPLLVGNAAGSFTYTEELEHDVFPWPSVERVPGVHRRVRVRARHAVRRQRPSRGRRSVPLPTRVCRALRARGRRRRAPRGPRGSRRRGALPLARGDERASQRACAR